MSDWKAWESLAQIVWDWGSKMGIGGVIVWALQRWTGKRDEARKRGQQLVGDARPQLFPRSNLGGQQVIALEVENRGKGIAYTRRIGFTGVPSIETRDEIPPGQGRQMATLNVASATLFTAAGNDSAEISLSYEDRHGNAYELTIPVTRLPRAGGGFNMNIHWRDYKNLEPKVPAKRLREIGGG